MIKFGHATRAQQGDIIQDEATPAKPSRFLIDAQKNRAPHHLRGQRSLRVRRGGRANDLSTTDHRDIVSNCTHLAQLVSNEDNRRPRIGELTHDLHQFIRLLRCQHGRRFVQNQDLRLTRQSLDNLNALLCTDRQILDERIGIQVKAEARRHLAHRLTRALTANNARRTSRLIT